MQWTRCLKLLLSGLPCYSGLYPQTLSLPGCVCHGIYHRTREVTNTRLIQLSGALRIIDTDDELATPSGSWDTLSSVLANSTSGLPIFWMLGLHINNVSPDWPQTPCYIISFCGFEVFRLRWSNAPGILGSLWPTGNLLWHFLSCCDCMS